jgi:hypothetical protein
MKKVLFILILFLTFWSCSSQETIVKNLVYNTEMNYIFSRINTATIYKEKLYKEGLFITIYEMTDSKATPIEYIEDFLSSYIVSAVPDGDYYSYSKLYKIEGLINPKILEIKETTAPNFSIKIEHGSYRDNKRKIEIFEFEGVQ